MATGAGVYWFELERRARIRVRMADTAYAPLASPARINVGFSGESSHPPICACAGRAITSARAREAKRSVFFMVLFPILSDACDFAGTFIVQERRTVPGAKIHNTCRKP